MNLISKTRSVGIAAQRRPAVAITHGPSKAPLIHLGSTRSGHKSALRAVPQEAITAGAGLAAIFAGIFGWSLKQGPPGGMEAPAAAPAAAAVPAPPPPPPRENAVLVLGATGRVGRRVVQRLLRAGRTVVAAARSADKAKQVFGELGLTEGRQQDCAGILFVEAGVDVTQPEDPAYARLWKGVTQVVSVLGSVTGPLPEGGWGVMDNMSPERVEGQGVEALVAGLPTRLAKATRSTREVLSMKGDALKVWDKLDDSIMGGSSSSGFEPSADGSGAVWKGNLIVAGGGFCGTRTKKLGPLDLSACDGIEMCIRGDGQTFKFNIKTTDQDDVPESTYQTTFDTVADEWTTVRIPWHNFVYVKRAKTPTGAPSAVALAPLNPANISTLGLVLSRLCFNEVPNPQYKAGPFELHIRGGINAYTDVRPQIVMITSAGVERNAIIGDDEAARKQDIPIVQLNPGGTLNYKYIAECAVRASGYPYTIVRATGLVDPPPPAEGVPAPSMRMEAEQGDVISGQISRDQVAEAMVAALSSPEAAGKTFELRRAEAMDKRTSAVPMGQRDWLRLFLKLSLDTHRWRVGLLPFPKAVPPPAPVTPERLQEILTDVARVRQQNEAKEAVVAK